MQLPLSQSTLHPNTASAAYAMQKTQKFSFLYISSIKINKTMARYSAAEALRQIMRMSPKKEVGHPFVENASRQGC